MSVSSLPLTPAILTATRAEFKNKVAIARAQKTKLVHIDVLDGKFVPHHCYGTPTSVKNLLTKEGKLLPFEVHLMVKNPEKQLARWKAAGAQQAIVHIEAAADPLSVITAAKALKIPLWFALNPETPISAISLILSSISGIVVMGVAPGRGGQRFRPSVLKKIINIRKISPNIQIAVDGGVRAHTIAAITASGASRIIAGSYFFDYDKKNLGHHPGIQ